MPRPLPPGPELASGPFSPEVTAKTKVSTLVVAVIDTEPDAVRVEPSTRMVLFAPRSPTEASTPVTDDTRLPGICASTFDSEPVKPLANAGTSLDNEMSVTLDLISMSEAL